MKKMMKFSGRVEVTAEPTQVTLELWEKDKLRLRLQAQGNIVAPWFGDKDATAWDFVVSQNSFVPRVFKVSDEIAKVQGICPACKAIFQLDDEVILIPIQAHGITGLYDRKVLMIPVHAKCYWPGVKR